MEVSSPLDLGIKKLAEPMIMRYGTMSKRA